MIPRILLTIAVVLQVLPACPSLEMPAAHAHEETDTVLTAAEQCDTYAAPVALRQDTSKIRLAVLVPRIELDGMLDRTETPARIAERYTGPPESERLRTHTILQV